VYAVAGSLAGEVAHWACDNSNAVTILHEDACHLKVTRAAWFIERSKSLVDQEDMNTLF
jgi:hypothetical protein